MSCTGQWTHQHHVHLPMYWGDAQSVATKNKQPRSIFVLVLVLLSLDTFPYVSAGNLVLVKVYSLVPQKKTKDQFVTHVHTVLVIVFPFRPT